MAWSAGVLAWSLVDFEAGYEAAGEYKAALDNVKWATDYFIKCIGDGKTDIVVQVRGFGRQSTALQEDHQQQRARPMQHNLYNSCLAAVMRHWRCMPSSSMNANRQVLICQGRPESVNSITQLHC
jgi:hypothetical protein